MDNGNIINPNDNLQYSERLALLPTQEEFFNRYMTLPQISAAAAFGPRGRSARFEYGVIPQRIAKLKRGYAKMLKPDSTEIDINNGMGFLNEAVCVGILQRMTNQMHIGEFVTTPHELDINAEEVSGDMFWVDPYFDMTQQNDITYRGNDGVEKTLLALIDWKYIENWRNWNNQRAKKQTISDEFYAPVLTINTGRGNRITEETTFSNVLRNILSELRSGNNVELDEISQQPEMQDFFRKKILSAMIHSSVDDYPRTSRFSLERPQKSEPRQAYANFINPLIKQKMLRMGHLFGLSGQELQNAYDDYKTKAALENPPKEVKFLFSFV